MKLRFAKITSLILATIALFLSRTAIAQTNHSDIATHIKHILAGPKIDLEPIYAKLAAKAVYESRSFIPIWNKNNLPSQQANDLLSTIEKSANEGLSPNLYHLNQIISLMDLVSKPLGSTPENIAKLDVLLTDAFLTIASNYRYGLVDPYSFKVRRYVSASDINLPDLLLHCIDRRRVAECLSMLTPQSWEYRALKEKLATYRIINASGGWPTDIGDGKKIEPSTSDVRLEAIKKRLFMEGYIKEADTRTPPDFYDDVTKDAVVRYQRANGLLDDGIIGRNTIDEMNRPIEYRIFQIKANMDRLRALSKSFEKNHYALVNIPEFYIRFFKNGILTYESKVITGKIRYETPLMEDLIEYIVFSPKWHVPPKIAVEDEIPKAKEDPEYFSKKGMKIYPKDLGEKGSEIDPSTIDWSQDFNEENLPYRIIQNPGAGNALGHIKFMFPNHHDVYLHDTPSKNLFAMTTRAFSHGCVRLEKPVELAVYLLSDKDGWDEERVRKEMRRSKELIVNLTEKVPIFIVYLTAWVDKTGQMQFRRDVYGYDRRYYMEHFRE